jgi:hypothetical protein
VTRPALDPPALVGALLRYGVAFVLIGGVAAEAQGVVWATFDLDVVIEGSESNCARLLAALIELEAEYDTLHTVPIRPTLERLRDATGAMLFRTKAGRLDVLKEAGGETYETLVRDADEGSVGGHKLLVASLAALVRMKAAAGRTKDRDVLPRLEAALRARAREDEE